MVLWPLSRRLPLPLSPRVQKSDSSVRFSFSASSLYDPYQPKEPSRRRPCCARWLFGPCHAGPCRTGPGHPGPCRASPGHPDSSRAGPSHADSSRAGPSRADPSRTAQWHPPYHTPACRKAIPRYVPLPLPHCTTNLKSRPGVGPAIVPGGPFSLAPVTPSDGTLSPVVPPAPTADPTGE